MGLRTPKQGSKRYRYLHAVHLRKPRELVKYQHCPATGKVCYATQEELRAQGWDVLECFECELDGRVDEFVDQTAAHMVLMKMKHAGEKQLSDQFLERWQAYAKEYDSADLVPTLTRQYKEIFTESFFADGPVHLPRRELAQWLYWCVASQRPRGEYPLLSRWRS